MEKHIKEKIGNLQDENIAFTSELLASTNDYTTIMLDNKIRVNRVLIKKLRKMINKDI